MIEFYLTVSLFCVGLHVAMNAPEMIGNGLANFLSANLPEYLTKPLFECLSCMGSIYTLLLWFGFGYPLGWNTIIAIFVVCGLNTLFAAIIQNLYDLE